MKLFCSALFATMLLMVAILAISNRGLVHGWILNDGCREEYNVCRPSGNGAPGGINAHGAPNCYLHTANLHEGLACPQLPKRVSRNRKKIAVNKMSFLKPTLSFLFPMSQICVSGRCVQPPEAN